MDELQEIDNMNKPTTRKPTGCTCKLYRDFRTLNRACPIHGDQAEAARRERAERIHEQRRAAQ
jgi:hypothetical protein